LEHSRAIIRAEIEKVDEDKNICAAIVSLGDERSQRFIEQNGRHFELL
jgi:hypothetical protein